MNLKSKIKVALDKLTKENLTLCLYNGKEFYVSTKRGISPLLDLINQKIDLSNYVCVDKVIGKAAAFLYIILNVKDIYCFTISKHALNVLKTYNINVRYENLVENIKNRNKDGNCPMETLVLNINSPHIALDILNNAVNTK